MGKKKDKKSKLVASAVTGAIAGAGTSSVLGGMGLAVGGTAVSIGAAPLIAAGTVVGIAAFAIGNTFSKK